MGNQTIAEQMIRHEPEVVLYAPLRTAICEGSDGRAFFVIDQPSALFGSFGNADITTVGRHLDALVATLLDTLGAVVPAELQPERPDGKETDRHGNNQKKRWSICRSCRGVLLRKWLHHRKRCPLDRKELRHETHVLLHV